MRNKLIEWLGGVPKELFDEQTRVAEQTMQELRKAQDAAFMWQNEYEHVTAKSPAFHNDRLKVIGGLADSIWARHGA